VTILEKTAIYLSHIPYLLLVVVGSKLLKDETLVRKQLYKQYDTRNKIVIAPQHKKIKLQN
jgi:hypothetical protein